jgi:hypothetical protein
MRRLLTPPTGMVRSENLEPLTSPLRGLIAIMMAKLAHSASGVPPIVKRPPSHFSPS